MSDFILKSIVPHHTDSGKFVGLEMQARDGRKFMIAVPYEGLPDLMLVVERAAGEALEIQKKGLKGFDPRQFDGVSVISCRKVDVLHLENNKTVLSLATDRGLVLNLAMDDQRAASLSERLASILQEQSGPKPKPS